MAGFLSTVVVEVLEEGLYPNRRHGTSNGHSGDSEHERNEIYGKRMREVVVKEEDSLPLFFPPLSSLSI